MCWLSLWGRLRDEHCPCAWKKPAVAEVKNQAHALFPGKIFSKYCPSYAVRLLQLQAFSSDEHERAPAAAAATIFSSLFCYWCIYTWYLSPITRIILTNLEENRTFRIQFILTKCLRKTTLFLSMLNYSSFSLILIKFLRIGLFSNKNKKKATQINEENVYSI